MRRHTTLVPLSRDHHEGLLLATRLQQGKKALLRLWSHDPSWQAQYVVRFFDDNLVLHFEAEEKVLFPLATSYIEEKKGLIDRLLSEHTEMKKMVALFRESEKVDLEARLKRFGEILEAHIRSEERELFPMCEERIPSKELGDAQDKIERYRPQGGRA